MKKKALAWILAFTMTLSSVSPVFAADIEIFGDSAAEAQVAVPVEENTGTQEEPVGQETVERQDVTVLDYAEPEAGENGEVQEPAGIVEDGNILSEVDDDIFQDGMDSQDDLFSAEPEEAADVELFSDGNALGNLDGETVTLTADAEGRAVFEFTPKESGKYRIAFPDSVNFYESGRAPMIVQGSNYKYPAIDSHYISFVVVNANNIVTLNIEGLGSGMSYTGKIIKAKTVEKIQLTEASKKMFADGVYADLFDWINKLEYTIYYSDKTSETVGNGKDSVEGYRLDWRD